MHCISAITGKSPANKMKAQALDLPLLFEADYVLVALDDRHMDYWEELSAMANRQQRPIILDRDIVHFFASELGFESYVLIETDYFGGAGEQKAALYKKGKSVFSSQESDAINQALRQWGVKAAAGKDEFDTIGLGRYRSFGDLFYRYDS